MIDIAKHYTSRPLSSAMIAIGCLRQDLSHATDHPMRTVDDRAAEP
jgi:hypothetical protein